MSGNGPGGRAGCGSPPGVRHHGCVASETAARPSLQVKTVRDMVLSMALLCLFSFALYVVLYGGQSDNELGSVEYESAAATAARDASYEVLVPRGLPENWRASSVRYEQGEYGGTWRLGFVTPGEEYVALAQADGTGEGFISSVTQQAEDTGSTRRVEGENWTRYEGDTYDALILKKDGATTVVFGTADTGTLARFAGTLQPKSQG